MGFLRVVLPKNCRFKKNKRCTNPSKIEWDLTNGPLSKLLELLDTKVEGSVQWVLLEISWNQTKPPKQKLLKKKTWLSVSR